LLSLVNQEYRDFEVIIANDGRDFYGDIADILHGGGISIQYRNNERQLGLYNSIKENMAYCKCERILVLEQDIVPLSKRYLGSLVELLDSRPLSVVTSKLVIDAQTDYKKYVFYKRRIANLDTFDRLNPINDSLPNKAEKAEIAFTKADLLDKHVLAELFSKGSANTFTAQDIILSSIVSQNRELITSPATACEIGLRDPDKLGFFLKKEYLYGNSVFDAWRHSDKNWLKSTKYFREKVFRVLFIGVESLAVLAYLFALVIGGSLQVPLLAFIFGLALVYSQAVLFRVGFWRFWRRRRKLGVFLKSGFYVILLDAAYALGILRRLL
jgi:hypothetical protein